MWPYWVMFAIPAFAALAMERKSVKMHLVRLDNEWMSVIIVMTLLIGYRYQVGGDWGNYLPMLDTVMGERLSDVLLMGDPGYQVINWFSSEMRWGIFGVNLMGGAIFSTGLVLFCLSLPRPWLALAVSVPYLVIVLGMGYSRQGIALGFAMLGMVALERGKTYWFVFSGVLGATVHKSAVLLLPIPALAVSRNRYWTATWVGAIAVLAYKLLLEESTETLYQNYVEAEYQSSGALVRLLMNVLPAMILLGWRNKFPFVGTERKLWQWFAYISLALFGILMVSPSSTAVDRVALYMLPLQLVVFSNFPEVFGNPRRGNAALVAAVLLYYAAVEFVWLNYADNAGGWIPYRFYPLEAWF